MKKRSEIENKYKWDFTDIYRDWAHVEEEIALVKEKLEKVKSYQGKIGESFDTFKTFMLLKEELEVVFERLYFYVFAINTTDTKDLDSNQKVQEVNIVYNDFSIATSFIMPELISLGEEKVLEYLKKDDKLKEYIYPMVKVFREEKHTLSKENEKLLSYYSSVNNSAAEVYSNLTTTDVIYKEAEFEDGKKVEITGENLSSYLQTLESQEDRRRAFTALFSLYKEKENTFASLYNSIVQKNLADTKARGYENILESYLKHNNISNTVYETLVKTTRENTEPVKRYIKLRKEALGLEEYHTFDRMRPLVEFDKDYSFELGLDLLRESVKPLGREYVKDLEEVIKPGVVDVFENEGKRGGAYSWGAYTTKPVMLLNYKEKLGDVFTLAHEAGHSMHSLYSNRNQPYATSGYTIFVAEVASTLNEHLLLDYMLDKVEDKNERIYMLQMAIDGLIATFYRQTLFADYELEVNQMAERGEAITASILNDIMKRLYNEYYGIDISNEEVKESVWARIPHLFQSPFYVYQYATSYAASSKIYKGIKEATGDERKERLDAYMTLLQSGGNADPIDQLKLAGADLTEKSTIEAVAKQLENLVNILEEELKGRS